LGHKRKKNKKKMVRGGTRRVKEGDFFFKTKKVREKESEGEGDF
jgi:hypothetical protein